MFASCPSHDLLTVPLIETMIVPTTDPNRSPADMVKGMAGIARIWDNINKAKLEEALHMYREDT